MGDGADFKIKSEKLIHLGLWTIYLGKTSYANQSNYSGPYLLGGIPSWLTALWKSRQARAFCQLPQLKRNLLVCRSYCPWFEC